MRPPVPPPLSVVEQRRRDIAAVEVLAEQMRAEIRAHQQRLEGVEIALKTLKENVSQ